MRALHICYHRSRTLLFRFIDKSTVGITSDSTVTNVYGNYGCSAQSTHLCPQRSVRRSSGSSLRQPRSKPILHSETPARHSYYNRSNGPGSMEDSSSVVATAILDILLCGLSHEHVLIGERLSSSLPDPGQTMSCPTHPGEGRRRSTHSIVSSATRYLAHAIS